MELMKLSALMTPQDLRDGVGEETTNHLSLGMVSERCWATTPAAY